MAKRESASWFKLFYHQRRLIDTASNEDAGMGLKAAFAYFDGEEVDPDALSPMALAVFLNMQQYIDEALQSYAERVENGKKGGRPPREK